MEKADNIIAVSVKKIQKFLYLSCKTLPNEQKIFAALCCFPNHFIL